MYKSTILARLLDNVANKDILVIKFHCETCRAEFCAAFQQFCSILGALQMSGELTQEMEQGLSKDFIQRAEEEGFVDPLIKVFSFPEPLVKI